MYFRGLIWRIPWIILQTIIQYLKWWELSNSGTNGKHLESFVFFYAVKLCYVYFLPNVFPILSKFFKVFFKFIFRNQCWHHVATRTAYNNSYSGANVATGDDRYLHIFLQRSMWASVCSSYRLLPPWDCVPASVNLLSVFQPASHGRSCFDSGGRTLSPAGLEGHKGQRCKTSDCEKGLWQSMTFWEQDKIRAAFGITGDFWLISIIGLVIIPSTSRA